MYWQPLLAAWLPSDLPWLLRSSLSLSFLDFHSFPSLPDRGWVHEVTLPCLGGFLVIKKKKKVVKHRSEVKSFDYSAYFTVFCGLSDYDVLYMNCRGTMKKLGCTTWHLSRKSISPTSLFFLIMVSNCMLLSYHCGFKLSISIFICCCNIIML